MKLEDKFKLTQEHVTSQQYFQDSSIWYNGKFIFPIVERSVLFIASILLTICISIISYQIREELPILTNMKYLLNISGDIFSKEIRINTDEDFDSNSLRFVTKTLCQDYVEKRENYDYDKLREQIIYMKHTSTKTLFKSFYDSLSTNNATSPLNRYQKYGRRKVTIKNLSFLDDNNVIIDFGAEAKDMDNKIFESTNHRVKLSFESDTLRGDVKNGTEYKFLVTGYKVQNQ
jgi:type IV secretion system protein VirB8